MQVVEVGVSTATGVEEARDELVDMVAPYTGSYEYNLCNYKRRAVVSEGLPYSWFL